MGKNKIKKNGILLSGFSIGDNNRGSAALGYGSISFLKEIGCVDKSDKFYMISVLNKKIWKNRHTKSVEHLKIGKDLIKIKLVRCFRFEMKIYIKTGFSIPFTPLWKLIRCLKITAATNGGDGFSDIYTNQMFYNRLYESFIAMKQKAELIIMPQTIGPFKSPKIQAIAHKILLYANKIYVRDDKYETELKSLGVKYEKTKDLSAFMLPEPFDIDIRPKAIGINVSGLAYCNAFGSLAGQFDIYPELINKLITFFQEKGCPIYLIPHSYNYSHPEENNDDIYACKAAYNELKNKENVFLIDRDLKSPQIKYVISKMNFFIGTRMHANFAAIYTNVPVFGLAYSYKFSGAFVANGLSDKQTYMINNMKRSQISELINTINNFYILSTQ